MNSVSLLRSNKETWRRQLIGIVPVSPFEEFSVVFTATNGHDVEMFVERERTSPSESTLPMRSVSPRARGGKVAVAVQHCLASEKLTQTGDEATAPTSAGTPLQARSIRSSWNDDREIHLV
jgi:hypothetical protein